MKTLFAFAILLLAATCFARIGEDEKQCRQRYSSDPSSSEMPLFYSDTKYFEKNGITAACTFYNPDSGSSEPDASKGKNLVSASAGLKTANDKSKEASASPSPAKCVKLNIREKSSKSNANIEASIPDILKANGGILRWDEVEKGRRWECVNKKFIATFDPKTGITIWDSSCPVFKKQAETKKASDSSAEAKKNALKGF